METQPASVPDVHAFMLMFMLVLINQGTRPDHLMLGFMLPTAFLSMWISNAATSAMMVAAITTLCLLSNIKGAHHTSCPFRACARQVGRLLL